MLILGRYGKSFDATRWAASFSLEGAWRCIQIWYSSLYVSSWPRGGGAGSAGGVWGRRATPKMWGAHVAIFGSRFTAPAGPSSITTFATFAPASTIWRRRVDHGAKRSTWRIVPSRTR